VRDRIDELIGRGALGVALALLLMGCVAVTVESQSDSALYWTGQRVDGVSQGGIVYYRVQGREYTVTDPSRGAEATRPVPVAVYVDRDDPSRARPDGVTRWVDGAGVGVWFVAALVVLPIGYVRRQRRRRRTAAFDATARPLRGDPARSSADHGPAAD
jgi:hypothetical protein